jgi:hypothetical protein
MMDYPTLNVSKKMDNLMSSDELFCEYYELAEERFSRARKEDTLLDVMLPGMMRKNALEYSDDLAISAQIRLIMASLEKRYNTYHAKKLAVLMAAYDRASALQSEADRKANSTTHKVMEFASSMSKSAVSQADEVLIANLKASMAAYARPSAS